MYLESPEVAASYWKAAEVIIESRRQNVKTFELMAWYHLLNRSASPLLWACASMC